MSYLFVDGGYLTNRLAEFSRVFTGGEPIDLNYVDYFHFLGPEKTFYYDALPEKKRDEREDAYLARLKLAEDHHAKLRAIPGCHVFNGKTTEGGKRSQQKGVDVLLATHMLTHVFRKNAKHVALLAGDGDFAPLVRALVMEGAHVAVRYARASFSPDLLEAADVSEPLRAQDVLSRTKPAFRKKYPQANIHRAHEMNTTGMDVVRSGFTEEGDAVLFKGQDYVLCARSGGQWLHVCYPDAELVERFAEDAGVKVSWK